jgi:hypothetical protein
MTTGSIPTNQKTYQNNTEILNKQNKKNGQIISIEGKLKNFKRKPNKTYRK